MASLALDLSFKMCHPSFSLLHPCAHQAPCPVLLVSLMTLPFGVGLSLSSRSVSLQGSAVYRWLSVDCTEKKWNGPALSQRALYRPIRPEPYRSVASLGNDSVPR